MRFKWTEHIRQSQDMWFLPQCHKHLSPLQLLCLNLAINVLLSKSTRLKNLKLHVLLNENGALWHHHTSKWLTSTQFFLLVYPLALWAKRTVKRRVANASIHDGMIQRMNVMFYDWTEWISQSPGPQQQEKMNIYNQYWAVSVSENPGLKFQYDLPKSHSVSLSIGYTIHVFSPELKWQHTPPL